MSSPAAVEVEKLNGPRSRKGAETRARLLAAAKEIFEENGFLDARISDIAERAGLSHGSFYHYFDSKEEVFREVAESVEDQKRCRDDEGQAERRVDHVERDEVRHRDGREARERAELLSDAYVAGSRGDPDADPNREQGDERCEEHLNEQVRAL